MNTTAADFAITKKAKDLTGLRFGSLVAICPVTKEGKHIVWEFLCDCGTQYRSVGAWVVAQQKKATNPLAPSCGCLNRLTTKALRLTHGMSQHPLFWVWVAMLERCYNPKHPSYPSYGAKGVYVCDEWRESSTAFMEWALANGWRKGLHLDKDIRCHTLNVPRHYSPQTCQFIPASENSRTTEKWLAAHQ